MRNVVVAAQGAPGRIPLEISFTPAGSNTTYTVNAQLDQGQLRLSPTNAFPLGTLAPIGTWRIRLRNEASATAYPEFLAGATGSGQERRLDLEWLDNALVLFQYEAKVRYVR